MNLRGLHVLLTFQCNYECDHCFVWGSPWQTGTFAWGQLDEVFRQAQEVPSIREFYFEGGEAFLYYPILKKVIARSAQSGYEVGVVSNAFWATDISDARAWLEPLVESGLRRIELSFDIFHGDARQEALVQNALEASRQLNLESGTISLNPPEILRDPQSYVPGEPVTSGGIMFRGRAAEKLAPRIPSQPWQSFNTCPFEDLADPSRVHLDPLGNLHVCQGIVMGNLFDRPLKEIVAGYSPESSPILDSLLEGGPAQLARDYELAPDKGCADACHLCYRTRERLRERFPEMLAPDQMYGVI